MKKTNEYFPTVGVVAPAYVADLFLAPALNLGINLLLYTEEDYDLESLRTFATRCDVITWAQTNLPQSTIKSLELFGHKIYPSSQGAAQIGASAIQSDLTIQSGGDSELVVLVARSAHGQATTWVPTRTKNSGAEVVMTISPAADLSLEISSSAQGRALQAAQDSALIGVASVIFDNSLEISRIEAGPHVTGLWTLDGSRTDQFEQHLRAILDLPLGDPSTTDAHTVMCRFEAGTKLDMYRPYLHLMARSPRMKFHQYKSDEKFAGHLSLSGEDLNELIAECEHARDYMSGVIDE